jgi:GxxExxY protein
LKIKTEVSIPLVYNGVELSKRVRMDILVENEIIIEVKANEIILPVSSYFC